MAGINLQYFQRLFLMLNLGTLTTHQTNIDTRYNLKADSAYSRTLTVP